MLYTYNFNCNVLLFYIVYILIDVLSMIYNAFAIKGNSTQKKSAKHSYFVIDNDKVSLPFDLI